MPFVQVLLLLTLLAYLLLIALENPNVVKVPLPFGQPELLLSTGAAVALFLALGGLYVALLLLPPLVSHAARVRQEQRQRQGVEEKLAATLGARVAPPTPVEVVEAEMPDAPDLLQNLPDPDPEKPDSEHHAEQHETAQPEFSAEDAENTPTQQKQKLPAEQLPREGVQ